MRILSYGGGVDSSAILAIHFFEQDLGIEAVVFSDTGAEHPDTYKNIKYFEALCNDAGVPFHRVQKPGETITEWCLRLGIVPVMAGGSHVCSKKFKGDVIKKWAEVEGIENPTYLIGIEQNEGRRVSRFTAPKGDAATYEYPLVDLGLDREACEQILEKYGLVVRKSSCVFCPFMSEGEIEEALNDPHSAPILEQVEATFCDTSPKRHGAWLDAGEPLNAGGRAPRGMWRRDSWADGQRLFVKRVNGRQLTLDEWKERFGIAVGRS